MAKKLNSMPDYQARMPKQPHDVSQSFTFTSSTGMLLPVYFDMLHTGDELHFDVNAFTRLNPLNAPTLGEIDLHFDYFFVPLSVMYTPATSIFYQTDDLISSVIQKDSLDTDRFPLFNIDSALTKLKTSLGVNGNQAYGENGNYVSMLNSSFDCAGKAALRLLDLLEYSYYPLFDSDASNCNPHTTPWFLLAYHACYQLYYRNDDRQQKAYKLFNADFYYNSPVVWDDYLLLGLNYASAYKDYFNSIKVSPIGSSMSMLNGSSSWDLLSKVNSYLYNNTDYFRVDSGGVPSSFDNSSTNVGSDNFTAPDGFTSANIRQLFMVDKLLRVTGRASKDYESQFLAHFGIKIPHDDLHNITHIGHDMVSLKPFPVVSSADTATENGGAALGDVGGQGYVSLDGKKRNFKAPFHGVFMVIFHAQPKFRYYPGISKLHDLSDPMKFWQPEYDRKGMQPLFVYEFYKEENQLETARIGWQFAYEHFKRKFDKVSLAFRNPYSTGGSTNMYAPWVMSRKPYQLPNASAPWQPISDNADLPNGELGDFTSLLSTPHDLDMIMSVPYQSTWIADLSFRDAHQLFKTDPLITDMRFTCKKVNFMSEYGEPELD